MQNLNKSNGFTINGDNSEIKKKLQLKKKSWRIKEVSDEFGD